MDPNEALAHLRGTTQLARVGMATVDQLVELWRPWTSDSAAVGSYPPPGHCKDGSDHRQPHRRRGHPPQAKLDFVNARVTSAGIITRAGREPWRPSPRPTTTGGREPWPSRSATLPTPSENCWRYPSRTT